MKKGIWKQTIGILVLFFIIVGCSSTSGAPKSTQAQFSDDISGGAANVGAVVGELSDDPAMKALGFLGDHTPALGSTASGVAMLAADSLGLQSLFAQSLAPQSLFGLSGQIGALVVMNELPKGHWTYNSSTNNWDQDAAYSGDDMVFDWVFLDSQNHSRSANLTVDWNYGGVSTVTVMGRDLASYEAPEDMMITLKVDGNEVGHLRGQFAWYDNGHGKIADPSSIQISGRFGGNDYLSFDISLSSSNSTVNTTGDIKAVAGSDNAEIKWTVSANGSMQRDSNGFSTGFDASSGNINVQTSSTASGQSDSFEFNAAFSNLVTNPSGPGSVDLNNGYIKVDGQTAVTFQGTLDDSNQNCVLGENLTLTFSDGAMSLEQYLLNRGVHAGCH